MDLKRYPFGDLLPALERLDRRLEQALLVAQEALGANAAADLYRGLYIDGDEVALSLQAPPGSPLFGATRAGDVAQAAPPPGSRLAWLQQLFGLDEFEMDVILLALAPEIDRRYERLYAYLQDHVSRRWPSVDLALHLLCTGAVERLECRRYFDPAAPLVAQDLIHLHGDEEGGRSSLLARQIKLDEQVVRFLLHEDGLDARLLPFCRMAPASPAAYSDTLDQTAARALPALISKARAEQRPLRIYLQGVDRTGQLQLAAAAARHADVPLLVVDLAEALAAKRELGELVRLVFRHARLYGAIPYWDGVDALLADQGRHFLPFLQALGDYLGVALMAGKEAWPPAEHCVLGVLTVHLGMPTYAQRRACWVQCLERLGSPLASAELDALADRFRLLPTQIAEAAEMAHNKARWRSASNQEDEQLLPAGADYFGAARAQSGRALAALARKIEPVYTWQDIVLPQDALDQLRELCQRVAQRQRVFGHWGFDGKLSQGKGVNVLFAGPSGAGKTMAAEIIANKLAVDLYKIDLSGVVSKYIGETEKNLNRLFAAAESANAILFFDEADALFGKRSEVSDAHDRYANIEISYLLQKMEEYDGVAILATNLRQNLDDAFSRRMAFAVHFPFPDECSRLRIWQGVWPRATPLAAGVDLAFMARQFKLSGGNIKNVALAAAFLAAEDDSLVTMAHLLHATRREYQKLGKAIGEHEFGAYGQQCAGLTQDPCERQP